MPLGSVVGRSDALRKLTEKDNDRGKGSNDGGVSTLLHDIVHNRNGETAHYCWQGAHSPVRDVVGRVAITDVRKLEVALETNEPSSKGEQQLREWGMDVEIIFTTQVIRSELAKMNLIETVVIRNSVGLF